MRVAALVSGGKDSIFSILESISQNHEVVALVNMQPPGAEKDTVEIDSYMFQTVGAEGVRYLAEAMNIPLYQSRIMHAATCHSLTYDVPPRDEVEDLFGLLSLVHRTHDDIKGLVSGAILSNYQRERVESICERLSWVSLAYLWRRDQKELLLDMVGAGVMAKIVKIASFGLDVERDLGCWIADFVPRAFCLADDSNCALNPCGEGGEFETFTFDCPLFTKRIVPLEEPRVVIHSSDPFATVAYLRYTGFRLESKDRINISSSREALLNIAKDITVGGDVIHRRPFVSTEDRLTDLSTAVPLEISRDIPNTERRDCLFGDQPLLTPVDSRLGILNMPGGLLSTATCIGVDCSTVETELHLRLKNATQSAFSKLELLLSRFGLNFDSVIHCHLTTSAEISDSSVLGSIDNSFKQIFDSPSARRRRVGNAPPSLVCLSSPWPLEVLNRFTIVGVGKDEIVVVAISSIVVAVEVRHTADVEAMRVRSLSYWAPAVTASYSQAIRFASECFYSGQIGLVPETLELPLPSTSTVLQSESLQSHIEQQCWLALRHTHRVMKVMELGGWRSLFYSVVYATSLSVLQSVRNKFHATVCAAVTAADGRAWCACDARVAWAVVSALPKGAVVQWQFATSRRPLHLHVMVSAVAADEIPPPAHPGCCRFVLFKCGAVVPPHLGLPIVPVVRFLEESVNYVCVNLCYE
ncbi:Diphthine--ammonia ligase [Echinococcus granulosus]|nr:Diphthine--ammonia ligase [Echinococcus granulosus]